MVGGLTTLPNMLIAAKTGSETAEKFATLSKTYMQSDKPSDGAQASTIEALGSAKRTGSMRRSLNSRFELAIAGHIYHRNTFRTSGALLHEPVGTSRTVCAGRQRPELRGAGPGGATEQDIIMVCESTQVISILQSALGECARQLPRADKALAVPSTWVALRSADVRVTFEPNVTFASFRRSGVLGAIHREDLRSIH